MNGADKPRRTTALDHGLGQLRHIGHGDRRSNISEGHAVPRRSAEGIELLADPTRRRIVALVASRVWRPADIAVAIGLSRPAISRQLRLLTDAGLLRWRWSVIDRRSRDYFVDPPMKEPIIAWLAGVDLRNVRPAFNATWSPPARIHRLRHAAKNVEFDRES
jgi:DNA-binding transcriptional ArsR family regulator